MTDRTTSTRSILLHLPQGRLSHSRYQQTASCQTLKNFCLAQQTHQEASLENGQFSIPNRLLVRSLQPHPSRRSSYQRPIDLRYSPTGPTFYSGEFLPSDAPEANPVRIASEAAQKGLPLCGTQRIRPCIDLVKTRSTRATLATVLSKSSSSK